MKHGLNKIRLGVSCLSVAMVLSHGIQVYAQSNAAENADLQPWSIACSAQDSQGPLICSMTQSLIVRESGQRVMSGTISGRASQSPMLRITLPHGVDLTGGVTIQVDELEGRKQPIGWADQTGSYAEFEIDEILLAQMKGGSKLGVNLSARGGSPIKWVLSLSGFTKVFSKLSNRFEQGNIGYTFITNCSSCTIWYSRERISVT